MGAIGSQTGDTAAGAQASDPAVRSLLEGLGRLSSTAAIYGDTHARVEAIGATVASALHDGGPAGAEIDVDAVLRAGPEEAGGSFGARVVRDLDRLGVVHVAFLPGVTATELIALARFVRKAVAPQSGASFEAPDFTSLPATIRVTPRRFADSGAGGNAGPNADGEYAPDGPSAGRGGVGGGVAGWGGAAGGGGTGDGTGDGTGAGTGTGSGTGDGGGAGSLDGAGDGGGGAVSGVRQTGDMVRLDGPTRALVQRMLAVAAREGVAAPDAAAGNVPGTGPRHVMNVREAVRAAAESLCRSLRRRRTVAGRDVADLLDEASRLLPRALPVVESKRILEELADSIDAHLRDAFAGERPAAAAPNRSAARLPRDAGPAEDDLAHAIRLFTAGARQFDAVVGPDVVEEFSIILQIRSAGGAAPDAAHVERRVAAAAASGLDEAGIAVLTAWVREACARTDAADFDALVAPVVAGLRRTEPFAFARAVLDAHHRGCREAAVIAWPYLAGVLLSANRSVDAPLREELATVLAEVPASRVRYEAERLEGLLEPTDGGTAPVVLSTPRAQLFPIYNVLFGLPAETGYPRVVLASFAKHAAAYPSMGALVNLPAGDERARRLLQQILRDGGDREGTRALAVEILVSRLRALPADGRDAPWIVSAVKSLGALPCSESAEFLEEVLRRRRWVIGWAWPESIRSVAAQARVAGDYRARMRSSSGVPV